MIPGILLGIFLTIMPTTISGPFLYCNQGRCPKIACFVGWEYRGYDINGREFMTCRQYPERNK